MRVSVVRNSSDERSSAWRARRRVEAQEATSSRPASSSRAPMRCARRRARRLHAFEVVGDRGHNRLAALRRRHECPLRDLVGDRPVTGVPDAGPDREGSSGDRPRDLLGVERCQITSRPASSDHNDELRRQGTEPRQGADDLRGRLGSLHCRGFEADVEQVPGPFQLAGEVPVSLRAGTGHEPDTKRHEGQGQPPVRLEEVLASQCAEQSPPRRRYPADQGLHVERGHGKAQLAAAFPNRDGAPYPHNEPWRQLDSHGLQLVLDDRPVPGPACHLERGGRISGWGRVPCRRHLGGRAFQAIETVCQLQVVMTARHGHLADLACHPDLAGEGLAQRRLHAAVEVTYRKRRVGGGSGLDTRPSDETIESTGDRGEPPAGGSSLGRVAWTGPGVTLTGSAASASPPAKSKRSSSTSGLLGSRPRLARVPVIASGYCRGTATLRDPRQPDEPNWIAT